MHDGETIQIGVDDDVGDVAVNKKFARREIDDFVGRNAAVGSTDPEILRRLLARKAKEEVGFLAANPFRPGFIFFEEMVERRHEIERGRNYDERRRRTKRMR